ncbi:bifunctional diaminohydroxyphosphoribosylaminopyrimidine deaminase/5-amino-6-(5-phosphoribosylamino)uracil reductase RibD [Diaphorobacter sp. NR2-3-3-1]|nr:bifunctional diaminohydroxyphosphoribosylaminopyrimidine deaminase/5-amino-6-(5-phosphoribosylamino)uracil reductase RibD [Diaphorobacter caeni]MBF5005268.1 bifunctional diaminohydroxyphosphoribosylaminopyrimidine deaminase/5-amino-6-(5-phosphoribosylamino)uracil reductase RibD [Diaphorobacter caeni]
MQRALALARNALFLSNPNPRVGCVIMSADGRTELGAGFTQQAGGPHAEVMALRDAAARGSDVRGATAYVTLEPCSHQGRTGPCCDALINAGIGKVVGAITDPNPRVAGQGFGRLRAAGIAVSMDDAAGLQSRDLNIGFFSRMVRRQPWVRLKAGMSLDGSTALANGQSQWITSAAARTDGHRWRAQACAILTGIGTVLGDDPLLNVRNIDDTPRQPKLVIVDSHLRTPPTARLFDVPRDVLIYCTAPDAARQAALEARGAAVIPLPAPNGQIDLQAMLKDLGQREINELHVEAGGILNGALMQANLVDECLLYIAPSILGKAQGVFDGMALTELKDAPQLEFKQVEPLGQDLRIRATVVGHYAF